MNTTTHTDLPSTISQTTHDEIARRAYELWLQEGCPHGRDIAHWREAERQVLGLNTAPNEWHTEKLDSPTQPTQTRSLRLEKGTEPEEHFAEQAPLSARVARELASRSVIPAPRSPTSAVIS
jgi:hypothetical protein